MGECAVLNLGFGELVVILMLVVLVFGATRLPKLGEGIGKAVSNFKRSLGNDEESGSRSPDRDDDG